MDNKEIEKELENQIEIENTENPVEEYVKKLDEERQKNIKGTVVLQSEEKPEYLLPQFKNIEEQAKSYKELQALQTKQAQELAQLKKVNDTNNQISNYHQKMADINQKAIAQKQHIQKFYEQEKQNLQYALSLGKISEREAIACLSQLKEFTKDKFAELDNNFKMACQQCGQPLEMLAPTEYFSEDLKTRNYLEPLCSFLEKNYKKLSKNELSEIKNLVAILENSLREEILNEKQLVAENENYRKNLASATNLNPQANAEKIFTLDEIKNMKPEEFRKNQQVILEQFVARKIK